MKTIKVEKVETKSLYKMSLAVSILSNILSVVHFGLLAILVLLVLGSYTVISNARNVPNASQFQSSLPSRFRDELKMYRDYSILPSEKYEVSIEHQDRNQTVKVKNLVSGASYTGVFTAADLSKGTTTDTALGSFGKLDEKIVDSSGTEVTSLTGQDIYDLSVIDFAAEKGSNGVLLLQVLSWIRTVSLVFLGFIISNSVYNFFKNIRTGTFFVAENVRYLKTAGIVSLISAAVPLLLTLIMWVLMLTKQFTFGWGGSTGIPSNWTFVLVAALFFMIAEIIQRGYELQLDKDMTI